MPGGRAANELINTKVPTLRSPLHVDFMRGSCPVVRKLGTASVRQKDFRLYRVNHLLETILTCGFKPIVKKETNPKLLKGKGHSAKVLPYDILVSPFQIVDILINFVVRLKLTDSLAEFLQADIEEASRLSKFFWDVG